VERVSGSPAESTSAGRVRADAKLAFILVCAGVLRLAAVCW
jgi:hypothetical protein